MTFLYSKLFIVSKSNTVTVVKFSDYSNSTLLITLFLAIFLLSYFMSSMMPTLPTTLLLITADPSQPAAQSAIRYAQAFLKLAFSNSIDDESQAIKPSPLKVFFYADGAHTANGLRWQSADQVSITQQWQQLASQYHLSLPVCVSTALARGVSDQDNARRHSLMANLARSHTSDTVKAQQTDQQTVQQVKIAQSPTSNNIDKTQSRLDRLTSDYESTNTLSANNLGSNLADNITNLASGFTLVGLGELATLMSESKRVIQF